MHLKPANRKPTSFRRIVRALWLKGFTPGLLVVAYGFHSSFIWWLWQLPGSAPPIRGSIGRGVIMTVWGNGFMGKSWTLGYLINPDGSPKPGVVGSLITPSPDFIGPLMDWDIVFQSGFKVPIVYIGALMLGVAAAVRLRARYAPVPGACPKCGHDVQDLPKCPECGRKADNARVADQGPHGT